MRRFLAAAAILSAFGLVSIAYAQTLPSLPAGVPQLPSLPQFSDPIVQADFALFQKLDIGQRFSIAFKPHVAVCAAAGKGSANCDARVITDKKGNPAAGASPAGYSPAQLLQAYSLSGTAPTTSPRPVIAIVDAYDDPNIAGDLAAYDSQFNIPQLPNCSGAITSSSVACLEKVNEQGKTSYPAQNAGWDLEISLDVEIAHATCQNCSIALVEASSNGFNDLMTAESEAVALGANVVSNSYGGAEFSSETSYDQYFDHPGIAFVASAGDSGYGVEYPASSPYVTAVGGTSLYLNSDGSYNSEVAWSGTGSGCSAFEQKPSWQTDTGCSKRTVNDVSADADPNTGAAIYDSERYDGVKGWFQVGGTSLAAPLVAATYALSSNLPAGVLENSLPYLDASRASDLHDVASGSNGSCGGSYFCTAILGYDGPTGLGTPLGFNAFTSGSSGTPPPPPPPPPAPSFSLSANSASLTVARSGKGTDVITVTPAGGFAGSVTLSASGLPSDVTANFNKNPAKPTSTLTISVNRKAAVGTYQLAITGKSGSLSSTANITLSVQ